MTQQEHINRLEVADVLGLDGRTNARSYIAGMVVEAAGVKRVNQKSEVPIIYDREAVLIVAQRLRGDDQPQTVEQLAEAAGNQLLPRFQQVTVNPGDFGTRFKVLDGTHGVGNRQLRPVHLSRLKRGWNEAEALGDTIKLVEAGDGTFFVADGQHRIAHVSASDAPFTFNALVYGSPLLDDPSALEIAVRSPNSGASMSTNDRLRVTAAQSPWPAAFEAQGVTLGYSREPVTAAKLIVAVRNIQTSERQESLGVAGGSVERGKTRMDYLLPLWRSPSPELIEATVPLFVRWAGIVAQVKARSTISLESDNAYTVGILLLKQNPRLQDDVIVRRIVNAVPELREELRISSGQNARVLRRFAQALLQTVNYRVARNPYTLFGQTGREL